MTIVIGYASVMRSTRLPRLSAVVEDKLSIGGQHRFYHFSSRARLRLRRRSVTATFRSPAYLRHNQRRQEHLATLGLPIPGRSVLETGAGIGDHTGFFMDRQCSVTVTDGRPSNVALLRRRFGSSDVRLLDLDNPDSADVVAHEIVYCYGTLYHLSRPAEAISYLASKCTGLLLLETCVSFGDAEAVNLEREPSWVASQATSESGCRPTRPWVQRRLAKHFDYAYATTTQPWHDEFPLRWGAEYSPTGLTRAVFVASRTKLDLPTLTQVLPTVQTRC